MSSTINKVVDRAIKKGWIPENDRQPVLTKIQQLGQKFGFTPDDFGVAVCTESYGLNPKAGSGCVGIIQFCQDYRGTPGIKTIKGKRYSLNAIKKLSVLKQLELTESYYDEVILPSYRKNMPGVRLYFFVLLPVVANNFEEYDPNVDLKQQIASDPRYSQKTANLLNGQAERFYVNNQRNGVITINSVKKGLEVFASQLLGEEVTSSAGGTGSGFTTTPGAGPSLGGGFGITTGIITGDCNDVFPLEFNLKEAITYKGCLGKITPTTMGGSSLAYPSQGMRLNGAGSISLADYDPSVPVVPGSLGKPLDSPRMSLTGNRGVYGARRERKAGGYYWHSGQDYGVVGGSLGTPVLSVADGVVVNNKLVSGYTPGTVEIVSEQLGNLFVRYGHITPSVRIGQVVKKGEVIGKVAPYPDGYPHLHLELRKDKGKGGSAFSPEQLRRETINPALYCKRK